MLHFENFFATGGRTLRTLGRLDCRTNCRGCCCSKTITIFACKPIRIVMVHAYRKIRHSCVRIRGAILQHQDTDQQRHVWWIALLYLPLAILASTNHGTNSVLVSNTANHTSSSTLSITSYEVQIACLSVQAIKYLQTNRYRAEVSRAMRQVQGVGIVVQSLPGWVPNCQQQHWSSLVVMINKST